MRIKINKGQTLSWHRTSRYEEGWSFEAETYHFDGEVLTREWCQDGRDCDGRLTQSGSDFCPVADLTAHEYDGIEYPVWQRGEYEKRDEYAEMMNY